MPRIRTFYSFDDECIYLRWVEATRPESWALSFGVFRDGQFVGYQGLEGDDFSTLRTVDSGGCLADGCMANSPFLASHRTRCHRQARADRGYERMLVEADPERKTHVTRGGMTHVVHPRGSRQKRTLAPTGKCLWRD
jgi:hypothetical protein